MSSSKAITMFILIVLMAIFSVFTIVINNREKANLKKMIEISQDVARYKALADLRNEYDKEQSNLNYLLDDDYLVIKGKTKSKHEPDMIQISRQGLKDWLNIVNGKSSRVMNDKNRLRDKIIMESVGVDWSDHIGIKLDVDWIKENSY